MESTMDLGTLFIRVSASLGLVLAILAAGFYVLKKTGRLPAKGIAGNGIRLLARKSVGPRHHLVMVEAADRLLLLGISPEGIRLLSPLGAVNKPLAEVQTPTENGEASPAFPDLLQRMKDGNA